ncbi:MAG: DUF4864 domain-containing protein [Pseudomonadota bacterium]
MKKPEGGYERIIVVTAHKPCLQGAQMSFLSHLRTVAVFAMIACIGGLVLPQHAAQADDARQKGIEATITQQLEAFRASDADAAWAIAAPTIQKKFGTKERFMEMVDQFYPQIRSSKSAIFKSLREVNGSLVQRVFIEGGPGDFVDAYYTMEQIDGVWRVTGVFIQKPRGEGA